MKRFLLIIFYFLFIIGCTSDDPKSPDFYLEEVTYGCNRLLLLEGGRYKSWLTCTIEDDLLGSEIESGIYYIRSGKIHFKPRTSSCTDSDLQPYSYLHRFTNRNLALQDDMGTILLTKIHALEYDINKSAKVGCYDSDGDFIETERN
jgi:hypothetical protein